MQRIALVAALLAVMGIFTRAQAPADLSTLRALVAAERFAEAEPVARALLDVLRREHAPSVVHAEVLTLLVESLLGQGKGSEPQALAAAERALAEMEQFTGPEDPALVAALTPLSQVHDVLGNYRQMLALAERAVKLAGDARDPRSAWARALLGFALYRFERFDEAESMLRAALADQEAALSRESFHVGRTSHFLGLVLIQRFNYTEARAVLERALRILERHPPVAANSANALAGALRYLGDYAAAKAMTVRGIAMLEAVVGPNGVALARPLIGAGRAFFAMRDFGAARETFSRSVAIFAQHQPDHPNSAVARMFLGLTLVELGNYAAADPLLERAIPEAEKRNDSLALFNALDGYARLRFQIGDLDGAIRAATRALSLAEQRGESHFLGLTLSLLGDLHLRKGSPQAAMTNYARALEIADRTVGYDHFSVSKIRRGYAEALLEVHDAAGAWSQAIEVERVSRQIVRKTVRNLGERQALLFATQYAARLDLLLAAAERLPDRLDVLAAAADAVVRSRALVLDELGARHRSLIDSGRPEDKAAYERVRVMRERLAHIAIRGPEQNQAEYVRLLAYATAEKDAAEDALAAVSRRFRESLEVRDVGLDDVTGALGGSDALVAYVRYSRPMLHPPASPRGTADAAYGAFVIRAGSPVKFVPLGSAKLVDNAIGDLRQQIRRQASGGLRTAVRYERLYRTTAENLRRAVWDPLRSHIASARRIFIVPDGALHVVNFAALPIGSHDYLIDLPGTIHYLNAERDLIPMAASRNRGLLALGNPRFEETGLFAALAQTPSSVAEEAPSGPSPFRGNRSACASFQGARFEALPASEREITDVAQLWVGSPGGDLRATTLGADSATESAIKARAPGHRVLHLATHGFFLGEECGRSSPPVGHINPGSRVEADAPLESSAESAAENPLLRSGLVLAGANHRAAARPNEDDGILTAEEIAALDLTGVEWAVLSACDTGMGVIRAGEGVFGLRRAFQMAGARTVIMSLWPVEDEATRDWMTALYRKRLRDALDTATAVRDATREVLRARRHRGTSTHPFYWAGFVAAGEWR